MGPSEGAREVGDTKKNLSDQHKQRLRFWQGFVEMAKSMKSPFQTVTPNHYTYVGISSGLRGVTYTIWVNQQTMRTDISIDRGKEQDQENKLIFDALHEHKEAIEREFGARLVWDELEGYRAFAIRYYINDGGYLSPEEQWPMLFKTALDKIHALRDATRSSIGKIGL